MTALLPGLHAALLLARGRADALALLPPLGDRSALDPMASARQSFWAAPLCVPAFICLHLLEWMQTGAGMPSARGLAADLIGFVAGWAAFALLSHQLAGRLGRAEQWPRFITLWNWCNLVQYMMFMTAALPGLLGLPDIIGQTAWLAALGWALWLEWFMTSLALGLPGMVAAGLVAMDVALGLIIAGFTGSFGAIGG